MPILVFLGLSVLDLGPMYATDSDRQTSDVRETDVTVRRPSSLNAPYPRGGDITMYIVKDAIYGQCN